MLVHQPVWFCLFISGQKSGCLCAFINSKMKFIHWPQEQKSFGTEKFWEANTMFWYTEGILVHQLVWFCLIHFWSKIWLLLCACINSKTNFIHQPQEQKSCRSTHNDLVHYVDDCAHNLSGIVLCNPFIWDMLLFISDQNLVSFSSTT